jgi:hypothetical protein
VLFNLILSSLLNKPFALSVATEYVVLLSLPQTAVPSADQRKIYPLDPPAGICLFPEVVG